MDLTLYSVFYKHCNYFINTCDYVYGIILSHKSLISMYAELYRCTEIIMLSWIVRFLTTLSTISYLFVNHI